MAGDVKFQEPLTAYSFRLVLQMRYEIVGNPHHALILSLDWWTGALFFHRIIYVTKRVVQRLDGPSVMEFPDSWWGVSQWRSYEDWWLSYQESLSDNESMWKWTSALSTFCGGSMNLCQCLIKHKSNENLIIYETGQPLLYISGLSLSQFICEVTLN